MYLSGSWLTITCDITVTLSVNANFTALVQWSVKLAFDFMTGSGESANVLSTAQATKIASNHYQSQLTISSLNRIKHTGNYTCAVTLASSDALLFVEDSNPSSVSTTVEINGIKISNSHIIGLNCLPVHMQKLPLMCQSPMENCYPVAVTFYSVILQAR